MRIIILSLEVRSKRARVQRSLVDVESGENIPLASALFPPTGAEHCHPSFNRRGDMAILTLPLPDGSVQVGAIDLRRVDAWAEKA